MSNNNNLKKLLFIGLLIGSGVTAAIVWLYVMEKTEEIISFSDFLFYCKNGQVKQVIIYDNYLKAAIEFDIMGHDKKALKFYVVKFHNNYTKFIDDIKGQTIVTFANTKSNSIINAIVNVIMQCIMLFITLYLLKKTMNPDNEDMETTEGGDGKTPELYEVVGFGSLKNEILKILKYWTRIINDPDHQQDFLLTLLFKGEPGTGKTFMANVMAKSTGSKFLKIDLSGIGSPFIHQTSRNIQKVFDKARELAAENHNVILFIDEIDSVMPSRSAADFGGWSSKESTEVITTILKNISGLRTESEKKIMVIGATNHDNLDAAFHSRVSETFEFVNPNFHDRYELINFYMINEFKQVDFPTDFEVFVKLTEGKSQRTIKNLLLNASVQAQYKCNTIEERAKVTIEDLFETLISSTKSQEYWVSDDEKMSIAMHESGHALIGYYLYFHDCFHLTVNAIGMTVGKSRYAGGVTFFGIPNCSPFGEEETNFLIKNNRLYSISHCILAIGGKIGEMYYFSMNNKKPDSVVGWGGDMQGIIENLSLLYSYGVDMFETKKIIKNIIKTLNGSTLTVVLHKKSKNNYLIINNNQDNKIDIKEDNDQIEQLMINLKKDQEIDLLLDNVIKKDIVSLAIDGIEIPVLLFNFHSIVKEYLHRGKQFIDGEKRYFFVENIRMFWLIGNLIAGRKIDHFVELSNHCKNRLITCDGEFFRIMNDFVK